MTPEGIPAFREGHVHGHPDGTTHIAQQPTVDGSPFGLLDLQFGLSDIMTAEASVVQLKLVPSHIHRLSLCLSPGEMATQPEADRQAKDNKTGKVLFRS